MLKKERGLGRGLDALLANGMDKIDVDQVREIELDLIVPGKDQPRRIFDESSIDELAESMKVHGVLQPIILRSKGMQYEIIAGERRWRAAGRAGLESVPAIVKNIDDKEAAEISLIENLQRDDLSVVEEARAYRQMISQYGYTQEKLANKIGKSRAHIANTVRILGLPGEILNMLEQGLLTAGHARTLLSIEGEEELKVKAARDILAQKLSVRSAEKKAQERKSQGLKEKPVEIYDIEDKMQKHFVSKVEIVPAQMGGRIQITYHDHDDLERILDIIGLDPL